MCSDADHLALCKPRLLHGTSPLRIFSTYALHHVGVIANALSDAVLIDRQSVALRHFDSLIAPYQIVSPRVVARLVRRRIDELAMVRRLKTRLVLGSQAGGCLCFIRVWLAWQSGIAGTLSVSVRRYPRHSNKYEVCAKSGHFYSLFVDDSQAFLKVEEVVMQQDRAPISLPQPLNPSNPRWISICHTRPTTKSAPSWAIEERLADGREWPRKNPLSMAAYRWA